MIEFQYFEGCPNASESLRNLMRAIEEAGIPKSLVRVIEIPDMETAMKHNFQGSPSIVLDGEDIYTGSPSSGVQYTCRMYDFGSGMTGVFPAEFLIEKLNHYKRRNK